MLAGSIELGKLGQPQPVKAERPRRDIMAATPPVARGARQPENGTDKPTPPGPFGNE